MRKIIMILIFVLMLVPRGAQGGQETDLVCIEENEGSLPVFWAQLRENIKESPSTALEGWLWDSPEISPEDNPCEFWMLPVTYEEAHIIYYWTRQFEGFFSTPLIYHYNWQAR